MYAYIDESGDTGYTKKSTKYFILTAVIAEDPFVLRRIVKKVHRARICKEKANLFHAYKETGRIKKKLAFELAAAKNNCMVFVLDKNKIATDDPYLYLLKKAAVYFFPLKIFHVTLARRDTRKSYNKNIIELFKRFDMNLTFSNPASEKALQIADFYSFVTFTYLENNDLEYFDRIKSQVTFIG